MKSLRSILLVALLIGGCFTTEWVSLRRVDPTGRVANLNQYLAWRPSADQFVGVDVNGKPHVIAYGPSSSWLLLSSGPSAYVFDDTGRLVDWSADIGDDPVFDQKWTAQASRRSQPLSRDKLQQLASTQPA